MRYSLGFVLALSLAGLQFVAIIIVVSSSYVSSERAILEHARGLMDDAGVSAMDHTTRFLEPAKETAELASRMIETRIVPAGDPKALEQFLFQNLVSDPQLSGVYYGDEAGNFVYVMRSDGPAPGPYRTKFVRVGPESRQIDFIWRNADFSQAARSSDPSDTFDPRQRQWYIDASTAPSSVWTAPYIFFSSQEPGITIASRVMAPDGTLRGVFGVDIEIADISTFLSELAVGDNGAAIILNTTGDVVAHPDLDRIRIKRDDGTLGFVSIRDIDDPITRAAFSGFDRADDLNGVPVQSQFDYQGDAFMTLLLPLSGMELPWTIAIFAPENDFIQGIKDNRRRNIWIAALISLVTAIVGLTLAELILKPVRAFAVRTALVSQGEVSTSAPLPRTYQELRKANQTLIHEIAQRRGSEAKVQELNRELSHSSRINMMGQMATGLAHELSQPLTAITQNVDTAITVAKLAPDPSPELLTILGELDEQAHQGGDIVRALRGFVRKDGAAAHPFDLADIVTQTSRLMRHETGANDVTVTADIPALPLAIGNRVQIAQVLINLMRNAVDAMVAADSPAKIITIAAQDKAGQIEISVQDTGPGIAPDVILFRQFQTSKPEGLGLGLSICRTIIDSNGGRLWHDTSGVAKSRFCFTVPSQMPGAQDG